MCDNRSYRRSPSSLGCRRSRSEYMEQLVADIASYYGYNDFLADKLFNLFPVLEVRKAAFRPLILTDTV